jgi:hypothetical protein
MPLFFRNDFIAKFAVHQDRFDLMKQRFFYAIASLFFFACQKDSISKSQSQVPFTFVSASVNGVSNGGTTFTWVDTSSVYISCKFSAPIDTTTVSSSSVYLNGGGQTDPCVYSYTNNDSTLVIHNAAPLKALTSYALVISQELKSKADSILKKEIGINIYTKLDSANKFPLISDSALLDLVQMQTLNYFWENGNAISGLAQERTSSGTTCTTGGTGFGIMGMIACANRAFISRGDALARINKITAFYRYNCTTYHGAFSHWINGNTGATVPFSTQDNGGDIVETSYLMQALLCARQYFSGSDSAEDSLRTNINALWNGVDWNWYRQDSSQNVLTWNWSPNYGWAINAHVQGWCEALITYVLAASASNPIPNAAYTQGWAQNGDMKNGNSYYGVQLPLGPPQGGPLFFEHYSFLGINPNGLSDAYANYQTQTVAHATINYDFCVANPNKNIGYSNLCWGLTACDIPSGYNANSPTSDDGVIAPTAAISSLPYTPTQSMNALRFFYYQLGDKIWGTYGFTDAFDLNTIWIDGDRLAIDQGPEIVMIENYRSGLLWNLFMSCPEVKIGMTSLGFTSPNLR